MFVEPMLARAIEESDLESRNWDGWVQEAKHDGMRCIVSRDADGVHFFSRTGKSQDGKVEHLVRFFQDLPVGTVLDGEIAMIDSHFYLPQKVGHYDKKAKSIPVVNFNATMRIMGSNADKAWKKQTETQKFVSFIVFDVISVGGIDSTPLTQEERWEILDGMKFNKYVVYNPKFPVSKEDYDQLVKAGIEGVILKDIATPYLPGKRSKGWLKVKSAKTFDVIITGYTEGQGKYTGQIGAIEFSAYGPDGLTYVGRCSGMTDAERKKFTDDRPIGTVIEIKANEMVGSGEYRTPRHPQYQHIRIDKNPSDCTMEQFKA